MHTYLTSICVLCLPQRLYTTDVFEYQFVLLGSGSDWTILRLHNAEAMDIALETGEVLPPAEVHVHYHPYDSLPKLVSHVHPHYAALNLALKTKKKSALEIQALISRYGSGIAICRTIFNLWDRLKPPRSFTNGESTDEMEEKGTDSRRYMDPTVDGEIAVSGSVRTGSSRSSARLAMQPKRSYKE